MENNGSDRVQKSLVNELVQGRDLAKQLHFLMESCSSSNGQNLLMIQSILSCFDRSLRIVQSDPMFQQFFHATLGTAPDSSNSFSGGSPKSQDSEGDFKDIESRNELIKRKLLPRKTVRVKGCSSSGLEGPIEDGFNWRKYGQKDILGAEYPRAYFRCTYKTQGCIATKQVQRCNEDPTYFEVTYRGRHSCNQQGCPSSSSSQPNKPTVDLKTELPCQSTDKNIIWDFKSDQVDFKSHTSSANNLTVASVSFGSSVNPMNITATQDNSQVFNHQRGGGGNFSNIVNTYQTPPELHQPNNFHSGSSQIVINNPPQDDRDTIPLENATSDTNTPGLVPEFSFDHGDFDPDDFMFHFP